MIHKNGYKIMKFGNAKTEEYKFHQYKSPISITDIDTKKQQYLISFLFVNKILNISLITNILKKKQKKNFMYIPSTNDYIKRNFDENRHIFVIKEETFFNKYMEISQNETFNVYIAPITLFDSIHRKDKNYYPKVFLEKYILWKTYKVFVVLMKNIIKNVSIYFQKLVKSIRNFV